MVNVLLETVPGPETTLKTTAFPEEPPAADKAIGATPYVTGEAGAMKLIVCDAWLTTTVPEPAAELLLPSPLYVAPAV